MAEIFYRQVKDNDYPLEKVPKLWRSTVKAMIDADNKKGGDTDG